MRVSSVTGLEKAHFQILLDSVGSLTVLEALTTPQKLAVTVGDVVNMNKARVKYETLAIGIGKGHSHQLYPTAMR